MHIAAGLVADFVCLTVSLGRNAWRKPLATIGCLLKKDEEEKLLSRVRHNIPMKAFLDYRPLRDALHATMFEMFTKYRAEVHWMKYFLWRLHTVLPENISKELAARTVLEAKSFSTHGGSAEFNQRLDGMRRRRRKFVRGFSGSIEFMNFLLDVRDRISK